MHENSKRSFLEAGLHICYMNYCATGEGVRSCIVVAGSARRAEQIMKEKIHEYFHVGIVTSAIDALAGVDVKQMIECIPVQVRSTLAEIPRGTGEYYSEFYYNLS